MKRRAFLFATGAGVLSAGEALASGPRSDRAITRHVRKLRRDLDATHDAGLAVRVSKGDPERVEIDGSLVRSGLRSMMLSAGIADLDEADRAHPEVITLVDEMRPEVDFAVHGMYARLAMLPDADRRRVRDGLRHDPAIADQVGADLERLVAGSGVSELRRAHFSGLVRTAIWRLKHQPFDTVLDELLGGVEKQSALATGPGPEFDPHWGERHARIGRLWKRRDEGRDDERDDGVGPDGRYTARKMSSVGLTRLAVSGGLLIAGAALLGIGVGSSSVPVALVASFVLTASVVMLIAGIVALIISAVRAGEEAELRMGDQAP